jgi:sulfotransferase
MEFLSRDKILKVMSLTRYHFVAGLPRSGAEEITTILSQNPRFVIRADGKAQTVFREMLYQMTDEASVGQMLDDDQRRALLRSVMDAVYHARPLDSVIFDVDTAWLQMPEVLIELYPLSRFIVPVRNPAHIVNDICISTHTAPEDFEIAAASILSDTGEIGAPLAALRTLLTGPNSERVILVDYDRLISDPDEAIEILYDFVREPACNHEFAGILEEPDLDMDDEGKAPLVLPTKISQRLSGKAFWRNLKKTDATMMLGQWRK